MSIKIDISTRLKRLPSYLFVELDKARRKVEKEGRDIIDLGVGDPDQPTPSFIIEKLYEATKDPANHRYALDRGMSVLREAISRWYRKRFGVDLNPDNEILPLIGSKEGIAHFPLSVLNRSDYALIPDPCYPPYKGGTTLAEGRPHLLPLLAKNDFLPDLTRLKTPILKKTKIIFVNYPNNPTSAVATDGFFKELIQFSLTNNIVIISDLAYSEIVYDGYRARSLLEFEGAKGCTIEFHSLSKTFNMTGWRIGWACGDSHLVALLGKVKSNIDSGIFQAIQLAGAAALDSVDTHIKRICGLYQERRDILFSGLRELVGLRTRLPKATFYLWARVPKGFDSLGFAKLLLDKAGIVVAPGVGFGPHGEGYIRFSLTVSKQRIEEALSRIRKVL